MPAGIQLPRRWQGSGYAFCDRQRLASGPQRGKLRVMNAAFRHGEGTGRSLRAFPLADSRLVRGACVCLLLACGGWATAAQAGMYRCQGARGETVFTSHTDGYKHCQSIDVAAQKPLNRAATPTRQASAPKRASAPAPSARRSGGNVVRRGAVYRVTRADGSIEYTNVRPPRQRGRSVKRLFSYVDTCVACAVHSSINWTTVPLNLTAYDTAVRRAAATYGISAAFLRAVIHAESAFNPNALSSKGAQGLMQLMPATAGDMGVVDAFDAAQNIQGGARYLAQLLKDFNGNRRLAAAAYNAGPQAVRKYSGVPPYAETRVYVERVGTLFQRYAKALADVNLATAGKSG